MTIMDLRQAAITANEKAARCQAYFEAGRCRRKQRDAARKAAEEAVARWRAAALAGAHRDLPVPVSYPVPRRDSRSIANDN